jgi:hypothetical protein
MTCKCGRPAHPLYGSFCEDCWVDGSKFVDPTKQDRLGPHIQTTNSAVTPRVQEFGKDRFWHKHSPKSES